MNELILQIIINKLENIYKNKKNINKLNINQRKEIRKWSIKMYQDYENNNELELIKDNNLENKDFELYINNNY